MSAPRFGPGGTRAIPHRKPSTRISVVCLLIGAVSFWAGGPDMALGQSAPLGLLAQSNPNIPEIGDRPRSTPPALSQGPVDSDSGIQIGFGPQYVTLVSDELGVHDYSRPSFADGVTLYVDLVLGAWRLGYAKQLLRRQLDAPVAYRGASANFIGVDTDQFWAFFGWRPALSLYLGAGLGAEYRLIRLDSNYIDPVTGASSPISSRTEVQVQAVGAVLVDWAFSPPFSLQARYLQDEGGHLVEVNGLEVELAYMVPF